MYGMAASMSREGEGVERRRATGRVRSIIGLVMFLLLAVGPVTSARSDSLRGPQRGEVTLREIDIVFGTTGLPARTVGHAGLTARDLREFVRERMSHDEFYDAVLPRMFGVLSRAQAVTPTVRFALKRSRIEEGKLAGREYYHIDEPCDADELERVTPWWNLDEIVLVCRDSYRPEVKIDDRSAGKQFCEAPFYSNPGPRICGCGEYLLACARDEAQRWQLQAEIRQEAVRTMQHVIRSRRPFSDVLSIEKTVHTDLVDMFYTRSEFFLSGELTLAPLTDQRGTLRSRPGMFGGGVLTTPQYLYYDPARRVFLVTLWEDFLCAPLISASVDTEQLLQASHADLRTSDHMELASMTGCKSCHAKLENGMRAFAGFTSSSRGLRYDPVTKVEEEVEFYVWDDSDRRGTGPATPAWIGEKIGAQPEFDRCMVRKVEGLLYSGYPVPEAVHDRLLEGFRADRDLATLFEGAAVARYLGLRGLEALDGGAP